MYPARTCRVCQAIAGDAGLHERGFLMGKSCRQHSPGQVFDVIKGPIRGRLFVARFDRGPADESARTDRLILDN